MSFWCYLRPLYYMAKALLIHPHCIEWQTGNPHVSIFGTMHSLTLAIGYYIYHVMMALQQMVLNEKDYNFVTFAINSYNLFSGCTFFLLIVVTVTWMQKQMIAVLGIIYTFDNHMEKLNLCVDNRMWSVMFYVPGLILFSALGVMELENCIMFIRDSMPFSDFCFMMCYIPMFVLIVTEWMFIGYTLAIKYRFNLINTHLQGVPEENTTNTVNVMKFHAKSLADASKKLNGVFNLPLLLLLLNQFAAMATLLYDLCMTVVDFGQEPNERLRDIIKSGGWSMLFMLEMLALCRVCELLEVEAHLTSKSLMRLTKDGGCLNSLQLLSVLRVKITPYRLFSVDMKLFYTMFGAIATYLIVLVQFDMAQDYKRMILN
uniref:Gustatory receptor n=1 Tax=Lutzomyia longipalpis TaxID=7200 RepID=A0A240SY00_LUTLO